MKRLFLSLSVLFLLLNSCSTTTVPQIGGVVPCQIQSIEPVEQGILAALTAQQWEILSTSPHMIEAKKEQGQLQVTIGIAYGYRGFSLEYQDSQNMNYDAENDTIDSTYIKWTNNLMGSIYKILKQEAALLPSTPCMEKNSLISG